MARKADNFDSTIYGMRGITPIIFDQFEDNPWIAYIFDIESPQVEARL